jgi:hypothetical protein
MVHFTIIYIQEKQIDRSESTMPRGILTDLLIGLGLFAILCHRINHHWEKQHLTTQRQLEGILWALSFPNMFKL